MNILFNIAVRLSSLLLLIGFGSFICYKLVIKQKKKKKRFPFGFESLFVSRNIKNDELFCENFDLSTNLRLRRKQNIVTSTPFINFCRSVDYTPSICSSGESEMQLSSADIIDVNDSTFSSLGMPSFQMIGDKTVAKLDQLLDQIQDIKKSVVEIDEQLFDVKESNVKFDQKLYKLEPEMSSSFNTDSDLNEKFNYLNTEPQTPSLEWDLTDLNAQNYCSYIENGFISSFTTPFLKQNTFSTNNIEKIDNPINDEIESAQDLSSPSISTSGEFSITSSSERTNSDNALTIQKMIEDAKKLGLLNDLLDVLTKNSKFKRDSAYFED
jgi:hypothetical protein